MKEIKSCLLALIGSALLLAALGLNGCAAVGSDLVQFNALAAKYGTPTDQECAKMLTATWERQSAILAEPIDRPAALTDAYALILINREITVAKDQGMKNCGELAAEVMVLIGQTAKKVRP